MSQKLHSPSKSFYVGPGKLEELAALKSKYDYNLLVTDDELSPQQQQNLEERLDVKVIDRVALILDIFARRAQTKEGRLQVELAQHEYLLPRLAGRWRHLERLGAGIGTRGPGESQLETDRRLIRRRIFRLQSQLEQVRKQRHLYQARRKKSEVPVAAIVGYTNAGKSTLFNVLTEAGVLVEDRLFATLDPTTRRIALPDGKIILVSDTVGFIRKLPPMIVSAFRATLEELSEASVLLHVVDVASPFAVEQSGVVEDTLRQLDLLDKPRITVLNKVDMLLSSDKTWDEKTAMEFLSDHEKFGPASENTVLVSAGKKWGIVALLKAIGKMLNP
jgi:GTP-binding protein HflX